MTDTTMNDASQGVVDTTEPVALPETIAADPGQVAEAGTPANPETPAEGTPPAAEATATPKAEPWFVKRLDKQGRDLAAEKARTADLERQLAAYRGQGQGGQAGASTPPQGGENGGERPLTRADVDRLASDRAAEMTRTAEFNTRCNSIAEAGQKAFPDFMDAIGTFRHLGGLSPELIEAAAETENPAAVLYAIGKNPDEAERILALPPARMGAAVAKIAARPAPTQPVSKAPAPLSPVAGSGRAETDPSRMSDAEWYAWSQRQGAKK